MLQLSSSAMQRAHIFLTHTINHVLFFKVKKQIDKLEQNSRERIDYLKHNIRTESEMIAKDVIAVLQSRSMSERLFDWRRQDCPGTDDKKKVFFSSTLCKSF